MTDCLKIDREKLKKVNGAWRNDGSATVTVIPAKIGANLQEAELFPSYSEKEDGACESSLSGWWNSDIEAAAIGRKLAF